MSDTFLTETSEEEFTFLGGLRAPEDTDLLAKQTADYLAETVGKDPEVVSEEIAKGSLEAIKSEATGKVKESGLKSLDVYLGEVAQQEVATPNLGRVEDLVRFSSEETSFLAPDVMTAMSNIEGMDFVTARSVERQAAFGRMVEGKLKESSGGITGGVGYFLDKAVSDLVLSPGGFLFDDLEGANVLKDLAVETHSLFTSDLPDADIESRFSDILDQVANAGLFSEENSIYLGTFLTMVAEAGEGPQTDAEQIWQVFDVATLFTPGEAVKTFSSFKNVGTAITKTSSRTAGKKAVTRSVEAGEDTALTLEGTAPSNLRVEGVEQTIFTGPNLQARRETELNNSVLTQVQKDFQILETTSDETIEAHRGALLGEAKERLQDFKSHELDYNVKSDDFGNVYSYGVLGNSKGSPYKTRASAETLASKVGGGEVREVLDEGKRRFVVVKEFNVSTKDLTDTTDLKQINTSLLSEIMSTTTRTEDRLDAMLKLGEGVGSRAIRTAAKGYGKAAKKVSKEGMQGVNAIFTELRDDPNFNWRTDNYTPQEFSQRYFEKFGKEPDQNTLDFYQASIEVNDTAYYLTADGLLKDAVDNGETMVELDGSWYRAKKATPVEGSMVYRHDTAKYVRADEVEGVYEIMDFEYNPGGTGKVRYVGAKTLKARRLYHTDVLGYNPGGPRTYKGKHSFFVKQEGEVTLGSGETLQARPKAYLAVRLEKEADEAVKGWNAVAEGVSKGLPTDQLDELVRLNNSWNIDLEDFADFQDFANQHGLDAGKAVGWAEDGAPIEGSSFAGERTLGDRFRTGAARSKKRGVSPLVGFGGTHLETLDPTTAIEQNFARAVGRGADQAYLYNAINGWLKAAEGHITNANDLVGMSPKQRFERAKIGTQSEAARALGVERNTVRFRLNNTTSDVAFLNRSAQRAAAFAYGLGGNKAAKAFDWATTGNPLDFFRAFAFNLKLGMFSPDQFFMQASQLINVAAISPKHAMRGVLTSTALRRALIEDIPEDALNHIAKSQAKFTGISPEDFKDLRNWVNATGRNIVDQTIIDENTSRRVYQKGMGKALQAGQVFFREGEVMARLGAAATNYLEVKSANPNADIFNPRITREMVRRQDILTASMTQASAAPWQKSLLSIPLQFMTYNVRMLEAIFTGGLLSPKERVRLVGAHVFLYGAGGVGVGHLVDKLAYEEGVEAVPFNYELARYGALDALLSTLTGADTALSTRLAVGEGVYDFFHDVMTGQKSVPEFVGGPSGSIVADVFSTTRVMADNLFGNTYDYTKYDINRVAQNVTAWNRATKFWYAQRVGEYYSSKSGDTLVSNLTNTDAVLLSLGVPLQETQLPWEVMRFRKMGDTELQDLAKTLTRMNNIAEDLIAEEDWEGAQRVFDDMGALRMPLKIDELERLSRYIRKDMTIAESLFRSSVSEVGKTSLEEKLIRMQTENME